jgi:acylphosphatase
MNGEERSVRLIIEGRVQGVGFRAFVADEAELRGLKGWVRNRRDGSVETLISGASDLVEDMIGACRHGPPGGRVDRVNIEEAQTLDSTPGAAFQILRTL